MWHLLSQVNFYELRVLIVAIFAFFDDPEKRFSRKIVPAKKNSPQKLTTLSNVKQTSPLSCIKNHVRAHLCRVQFYLLPSPPGTPPGICIFFLTWRPIPHPRAGRKRQFSTPRTPHRPQIRCFVFKIDFRTIAQPDVLTRT